MLTFEHKYQYIYTMHKLLNTSYFNSNTTFSDMKIILFYR